MPRLFDFDLVRSSACKPCFLDDCMEREMPRSIRPIQLREDVTSIPLKFSDSTTWCFLTGNHPNTVQLLYLDKESSPVPVFRAVICFRPRKECTRVSDTSNYAVWVALWFTLRQHWVTGGVRAVQIVACPLDCHVFESFHHQSLSLLAAIPFLKMYVILLVLTKVLCCIA